MPFRTARIPTSTRACRRASRVIAACGVALSHQMLVGTQNDRIVAIKPGHNAPVNKGPWCVKGHYRYRVVYAADDVTSPVARARGKRFRGKKQFNSHRCTQYRSTQSTNRNQHIFQTARRVNYGGRFVSAMHHAIAAFRIAAAMAIVFPRGGFQVFLEGRCVTFAQ